MTLICPECQKLDLNEYTDYTIIQSTQDHVEIPQYFVTDNGAEHTHYRKLQSRIDSLCSNNHYTITYKDLPRCDSPGCVWHEQLLARLTKESN
jgi:hypothetical protein